MSRARIWRCAVRVCMISLAATASAVASPAVQVWVTTADQKQLLARKPDVRFRAADSQLNRIDVDPTRKYQEIVGFGAAITDASAWLIQTRLNESQRSALLHELFGRPKGLGLSMTRITIGASDFSREHYSLDDPPNGEPDPALTHFSIERNRADVLPVLKAALQINPSLRIVASPWSPPGWMKDSGRLIGGRLRPEAHRWLGDYLVRFTDAYAAEGIPVYALTLQNEPDFEPPDYPGMKLSARERADIIGRHLGPLLGQRPRAPLILDWDHNWDHPEQPLEVLADPNASKYVAGVAWHCYKGDVAAQAPVHDAHPDKDAYLTECSGGEWEPKWESSLRWFSGELIIGSTRGWSRGVVLWNIALDENHGPHAGGCDDCRGVVTINSKNGAITRNVEYYVLAHASRFVRPGAHRIDSTMNVEDLPNVAFQNADDGSLVLIVLNAAQVPRTFSVRQAGKVFPYTLPAGGLATFNWRTRSAAQ